MRRRGIYTKAIHEIGFNIKTLTVSPVDLSMSTKARQLQKESKLVCAAEDMNHLKEKLLKKISLTFATGHELTIKESPTEFKSCQFRIVI